MTRSAIFIPHKGRTMNKTFALLILAGSINFASASVLDCTATAVDFASQKTATANLASVDGLTYEAQVGGYDFQAANDPDGYGYFLSIRTAPGNVAVANGTGFFSPQNVHAPLNLFGRTQEGSAELTCFSR